MFHEISKQNSEIQHQVFLPQCFHCINVKGFIPLRDRDSSDLKEAVSSTSLSHPHTVQAPPPVWSLIKEQTSESVYSFRHVLETAPN